MLTENITRSLAYMLRHRPEEFELELDEMGYAHVEEVVQSLIDRLGQDLDEEDLVQAVEEGDRPRYEVKDGRIRALYGHSFFVEPGEPSEPPEFLYVGVGSRDARRAEEQGLCAGRRAFLHLALDYEEAQEMGRRVAPRYAVVTVQAAEASASGIPFYDRSSLYLCEELPTEFIEVGETQEDGHRRDRPGRRRSGGEPERHGDDRQRSRVQGRRSRNAGEPERDQQTEQPREESFQEVDAPVQEPAEQAPESPLAESSPRDYFADGIFAPQAAEASRDEQVTEPDAEPDAELDAEPDAVATSGGQDQEVLEEVADNSEESPPGSAFGTGIL